VPLLGKAAVAMWWDMAPAHRVEFEDWHSHEHFPERMSIPGFLRGSRWSSSTGGDGFFVMYELDVYETLTSPHYLARLNDPTPWSTKMMPRHRNMVRSQCRVMESFGGGIARSMVTVRVSPAPGQADVLRESLRDVLARLACAPGIAGGHLLQTHTPKAGATEEQKIRGGADAIADWIVLVNGYDAQALAAVVATQLSTASLAAAGAAPEQLTSAYDLAYTLTPRDL
jgi:hypothetical protein